MIIYAANGSKTISDISAKYPGRIGRLVTPHQWDNVTGMPYAIDNGAFKSYSTGEPWDQAAFEYIIEKAISHKRRPEWVAVPDVVGNRKATLASWERWAGTLKKHFTLALCVQDGMTEEDVPEDAEVIFVGGTTEWKWITVGKWSMNFTRVHVGRVNTEAGLWRCHYLGVESCDGTGWIRNPKRLMGMRNYLKLSENGSGPEQQRLFW